MNVSFSCLVVFSLLAAVVPAGCAEKPGAEKPGSINPRAADLCNERGNVQYTARWEKGKVTLAAKGEHNTGGYKVEFQKLPIEIFPPQFNLTHQRPSGIVTQAITPFAVTTSFPAADKPKQVTVNDAQGPQQIPVK